MNKLEKIMNSENYISNTDRRSLLVLSMNNLIDNQKDCFSCVGHCCTYEFNSMRITPLEALDLTLFLKRKGEINEELKEKLQKNISKFRLDKEFNLGRGKSMRRYYTCPFYAGKSKGCTISRQSKPYGCLAFNPLVSGVKEKGYCSSYQEKLQTREEKFSQKEERLNQLIKDTYNLYWDKKDISSAVLILTDLVI